MEELHDERLQVKAEVFKVMGHPLRPGVIEFLADAQKCVCEIVDHSGTVMSTISKHLSVLKRPASLGTTEMVSRSCKV